MPDIVEDLKEKRRVIEQLRQDKSRQEGQHEQLSKQLKDECGVDGIVEAEKVIQKLTQEFAENEEILIELDEEMDQIIRNATPGGS